MCPGSDCARGVGVRIIETATFFRHDSESFALRAVGRLDGARLFCLGGRCARGEYQHAQ